MLSVPVNNHYLVVSESVLDLYQFRDAAWTLVDTSYSTHIFDKKIHARSVLFVEKSSCFSPAVPNKRNCNDNRSDKT